MDPVADAYASCPRYEATDSSSGCRCPCPGCQHHCAAHREADEEAYAAAYPDRAAEDEAEGFLTEDNGLEGCGVCTQFTPCPNPGIGCYVNPPDGRLSYDASPIPFVRACTLCDDSDDEYCAFHDPAAQQWRVHTTVADGVTYTTAAPDHRTPRPDSPH